jgi:hypothetical protein
MSGTSPTTPFGANFRNGRAIRRERATKTENSTLLPIYHSPIVPVRHRGGKGEPACLLKLLNLDWASHRVDAHRSMVKRFRRTPSWDSMPI